MPLKYSHRKVCCIAIIHNTTDGFVRRFFFISWMTMLFFLMLYYRCGGCPADPLAVLWGFLIVKALKWLFYDVQTLFCKAMHGTKALQCYSSNSTLLVSCRHLVSLWYNRSTQGSAIFLDNWRNTSRNGDLWFKSVLKLFLIVPAKICKLYLRHVMCWMLWTLVKGLFPPSQWGIYLQIDTLSCILNRK